MNNRAKYSLTDRWFLFANVQEKDLDRKGKQVAERIKRYPNPVRWVYPWLLWFVEWFGPLIVLFSFSRASQLTDDKFELFIRKLKQLNNANFRGIGIIVFLPLMEFLGEANNEDLENFTHPLQDFTSNYSPAEIDKADVIIIGSGAGGAPVALELCKKGLKVVMLEKGGFVKPEYASQVFEKHYVGQGLVVSINGGTTLAAAGSTIGGTTSVNSGTCFRPLENCLEQWEKLTACQFTKGILDPYFERVEQQIGVCIPDRSLLSKSSIQIEKGLKAIGRDGAFTLPRNIRSCKASGRCAFCCPTGAKQSTDRAYIPEALKQGLKFLIQSEVVGIKEHPKEVAVDYVCQGQRYTITGKTLIISGGALLTPKLLKENRLGTHWGQSGNNLRIHPATKVFAYFPGLNHGAGGIPQGTGYKPPELPRISMEGIHTPISMTGPILAAAGDRFNWWMDKHNDLASFGFMIQDRGTGSVINKIDFPLLNYKLHHQDTKDAIAALKIIAQAFFAAGAERCLLPLVGKHKNEFSSVEELDELDPTTISPKNLLLSGFHPQGTASMGQVVDTNLKLKGSQHIFVCDASVLPDSPGVNPQISIMGLSLRLADYLMAQRFN